MRRSKTHNGTETKFYWDRGYMSAESVDGTFTAKNYIGATGIFARESVNNTEYMLKNGHGDVTNILQNGTVSNWLDYDPYGNQTMGNTSNPFRYCGEYFDEESGLIYLRNRYYNPEIGRFITEDPIQDGLNWYAYCGNNPVNFWDPLGLSGNLSNTEVYLRDMFDMYKSDDNDKIDVYDDRVTVNLNGATKTYYYDTEKHNSADGNRMDGDRMIVDAVYFAKHFGLQKSSSNIGTQPYQFTFANSAKEISLPILALGGTRVNWGCTVAYVETPTNKIVYYQAFSAHTSGWTLPKNEIPTPTFTISKQINFTQNNFSKNVNMYVVKNRISGGNEDSTASFHSNERSIFSKDGVVTANVSFSLIHNDAFITTEYSKRLVINF